MGTFFVDQPTGNTSCTGSVVHSPGHNLVLTAGHCAASWNTNGTHRIFVPQYTADKDAAEQPYGFFPIDTLVVDPRYSPAQPTAAITDLDFAFARIGTNATNQLIEDVTGALTLKTTPSYTNTVTVIGYPEHAHNPTRRPITCTTTTNPLTGYRQMKMLCRGYYNGTSGGPWIANYNPTTHTGDVIGEIGGRGAGGNDTNDDWISYSPYYNNNIIDLYNDAVANQQTPRTPYQGDTDPDPLPGGAGHWKTARLMASGDYTGEGHSDLLVVWTNGRVSLFPSDGAGNFLPEHTILSANTRWNTAKLITSGNFDGTSLFDLMVVWNNGQVSSFPDVSTKGLGTEKTFAKAGSIWSSATQITAGRFSNNKDVSDLIVRWVDGELSLYTNTGATTLGQEHQLQKPNATWKNATLLTSGQYAGTTNWDLFVRWVDGELDTYPNTTAQGLGTEKRIQNTNTTWTHDTVMTTGHYTTNPYTDDLVIRWSDGETTMYTDTKQNHLGTEHTLVKPGT